jgi:heme/copper-type cytochrome/quinol oxidase subunit 1
MPTISVRLLRLSLLALMVGAGLGAWLLGAEPWSSAWLPRMRAAHVHLMLFGWLLPFVVGTAYWILPRHARGPERGPAGLATAGFWLVGLGGWLGSVGPLAGLSLLQRGGLACSVAGTGLFLRLLWPRVKAFGRETQDP